MSTKRKLGRPTDQRMAMLKNLSTSLIMEGKIETTVQKAKEIKPIADKIIFLAIKEKDNFDMVKEKKSIAKVDSKGKKVTQKATSKNGKTYYKVVREEVEVEVKKDRPSRLAARRKMMKMINKVKDADGKNVDLLEKLFDEIATKYEGRVGGYTRIIRTRARRGDNAEMAIIELI